MYNSKISVYDLAFEYIRRAVPLEQITKDVNIQVKASVETALGYGVSGAALMHGILQMNPIVPIPMLSNLVIGRSMPPNQRNLLKDTSLRLHPELRITPPPPVTHFDINTGEIVRYQEDFYLEPVASFSADDLYRYYISKDKLLVPGWTEKRIMGGLTHLLTRHSVEDILFMIDAAELEVTTNNKKPSPVSASIEEYYQRAIELKDNRKSQSVEAGETIVTRSRMLSYGSRTCVG